jgi:hypothetical protein
MGLFSEMRMAQAFQRAPDCFETMSHHITKYYVLLVDLSMSQQPSRVSALCFMPCVVGKAMMPPASRSGHG